MNPTVRTLLMAAAITLVVVLTLVVLYALGIWPGGDVDVVRR